MGKKKSADAEPVQRKGKKGRIPFNFLGTQFDTIDQKTVKNHILLLIIVSLVTKLMVIFLTTSVFHSFIDYFDIGTYFEHAVPLLNGQLPYVNYQIEYPVLSLVPIILAFIPAALTQNALAFIFSFQILMVVCDIIIVLCIYFTGLKISSEKNAYYAGLIYATAFSTAYFVLTKSDAFPTSLLMGAILFTVYGMNTRGYISATLGFFTKLFPAIALPFMVLYNSKTTSIKQELISAVKIFVLFCIVLLGPFVLINPEAIRSYLLATGGALGIYANTATFALYSYLHDVFHIGISSELVSGFMYILMGAALLFLVYVAWITKEKNPFSLLKLIVCAIFCLVLFTKFHSPQYIVWFTPLLVLLVVDNPVKIVLFYFTQVFAYIEFPLMFGKYYVNTAYTNTVGTPGWYLTLLFFTVEYLALIILFYCIIAPKEGIIDGIKKYYPRFPSKKE
jgi:hypothetical protein